jgi:hypothetical protein
MAVIQVDPKNVAIVYPKELKFYLSKPTVTEEINFLLSFLFEEDTISSQIPKDF